MGLDMFLYGVKRVKEEDVPSVVTEEWIENTGLRNADIDRINAKDLLPYSVVRTVLAKVTDYDKIKRAYGIPENAIHGGWCCSSSKGFVLFFYDEEHNQAVVSTTKKELDEKFTKTVEKKAIVFSIEELAYWRKNYDLQDFFYENLESPGNVTFSELSQETLGKLKSWLSRRNLDKQKIFSKGYDAKMYYEWW